jgi:hypothetical protein
LGHGFGSFSPWSIGPVTFGQHITVESTWCNKTAHFMARKPKETERVSFQGKLVAPLLHSCSWPGGLNDATPVWWSCLGNVSGIVPLTLMQPTFISRRSFWVIMKVLRQPNLLGSCPCQVGINNQRRELWWWTHWGCSLFLPLPSTWNATKTW